MGPGNDLVRGNFEADVLQGGPGNDFLASYEGDDQLDGGAGDDGFDPQFGADDVVGGAGYDTIVYYKGPTQPVSVTLDDVANDGEADEHDNIHGDVEDITGGNGNDKLTGNAQTNVLRGDLTADGAGADQIDGGAGTDSLFGHDGDDTLRARDGNAEPVDCGPGTDTAIVDTTDVLRNCETVDASDELIPRPAPPVGGVEDRDGDGYPPSVDCDDGNPAINPGAADVPGNRIDEDCRGGAARYPVLDSTIAVAYRFSRVSTTFTKLALRRARRGSTVRVRCAGKGCSFKAKRVRVKRDKRELNLSRLIRGLKLRPGAAEASGPLPQPRREAPAALLALSDLRSSTPRARGNRRFLNRLPLCRRRRRSETMQVSSPHVPRSASAMHKLFSRVRRVVSDLPAEDRPNFKRVDASSAAYDDGSWLEPAALRSASVRVNV
jgi:hypothetical protein